MFHRFVYFFCLTLFLTACGRGEKEAHPQFTPIVSIKRVEPQLLWIEREYLGVTESSHQVEIRARIEGYLDEIAYVEGNLVEQGALLFQIDPRPFIASLDSAQAQLARAEAELWDAQKSAARMEKLYEKKAVSQRDYENATARLLSAEANQDAAKAHVVQAELNLAYTKISSPVTGLTDQSKFRTGALIVPGPTPSSLLTTVSVINPIWVNFTVSERDLLKMRDQVNQGRLVLPADNAYEIEVIFTDGSSFYNIGKIDFASPVLDQKTSTLMVRAIFENEDKLLIPGQYVTVRVKGAKMPQALAVPKTAVMQGAQGHYVYLLDEEQRAQMRLVKMGDWYEELWIVNEGMRAGELLVIEGTSKLTPGQKVLIAEKERTSKVEERAALIEQEKEALAEQKKRTIEELAHKAREAQNKAIEALKEGSIREGLQQQREAFGSFINAAWKKRKALQQRDQLEKEKEAVEQYRLEEERRASQGEEVR